MSVGGVVKWGILRETVPTRTLSLHERWGGDTTPWRQRTPITRSLLNDFLKKLMRSERKQEITKAKLKKAWQQLNTSANPNQTGGGAVLTPPAKLIPPPAGPPAIMPPPANVPRKVQVERPAKVVKPRTPPQAAVGPKKLLQQNPW